MPPEEFVRWRAYYDLEPWGAWRTNRDLAQLTALTHNIHRGKGSPACSIDDYMYEDPAVTADRKAKTFIAQLKSRARRDKDGG